MKVLMFGWEFSTHIIGDLGAVSYGLCMALIEAGVEVVFVAPKKFDNDDTRELRRCHYTDIESKLKTDDLHSFRHNFTYLEINTPLGISEKPEQFPCLKANEQQQLRLLGNEAIDTPKEISRFAAIAASIAKQYSHDIIHAHDGISYAAAIAAQQVSRKPMLAHVHTTAYNRNIHSSINKQVYDMELKGMQAADQLIAVSNLTKNIIQKEYGIDTEKIRTVYNALLPITKYKGSEDKKVLKEKLVCFIGRLSFQKGPGYFIEAAKKILDYDKNVRFVMGGAGELKHELIQRVASLKIADKFHFTGSLQAHELCNLLCMSDVFVMPSVSEPFGLAALEAMHYHLPVVISKQSGAAELLTHALKVDFWDIDALTDAIYALLHRKPLAQLLKEEGQKEVKKLNWHKPATQIKTIYQSLISQYQP